MVEPGATDRDQRVLRVGAHDVEVWAVGRRTMGALACVWMAAISVGMASMARHSALASPDAPGPTRWPAGSALEREPGRGTVLCFVHPRCPCTRATVRELERVVSRAPRAAVRVVFRDDPGGDVTTAATWEMAARVPGARRVRDPGGVEARRFGASTSGLVVLFDAGGALRFRGGVTPGRGHEGESEGAAALLAALRGREGRAGWSRVFGCGLVN